MLFTKNFSGTVIRIGTKGIGVEEENDDFVVVRVAAGENWDDFVRYCVEKGWGGLENLSLIPGNVGTGPIQNIGAYGVEIKDVILDIEVFRIETMVKTVLTGEECEFGYRDSIFKGRDKGKYFILSVRFRLSKHPDLKLDYGSIREELQAMKVSVPTIADVRNAVCRIRQRKLPDPQKTGNAGSFFKNPVVSEAKYLELKERYPAIVSYPSGACYKIAAAWMIEHLGWKGKRAGDAGVHEHQPLVLVNYGSATGKEILQLADLVSKSVFKEFGVRLETEVNVY